MGSERTGCNCNFWEGSLFSREGLRSYLSIDTPANLLKYFH